MLRIVNMPLEIGMSRGMNAAVEEGEVSPEKLAIEEHVSSFDVY